MPRIESHRLLQTVIVWPASGEYTDSGMAKVYERYDVLSVRWEEINKTLQNEGGETIGLDVTMVVNQDVPVNSIVWLGTEDDLPDPVTGVTDLYQVVSTEKIPNLKGGRHRRELGLRKYSDKLPPTQTQE